MTYVLDSSAILRYLDDEPGAARVAEILKGHLAGKYEAIVSALHWGEVAGITCKVHGDAKMDLVLSRLEAFGLQVIAADAKRAVTSALIKLKKNIPYIDAFGIELTASFANAVFVTADFDFKAVGPDVKMEFLPTK